MSIQTAESAAAGALSIGAHTIGPSSPVFIIAEIGLNHDGSVERARELIDRAIDAHADCVKFQMRDPDALYARGADPNDPRADLSVQYVLDVVRRTTLAPDAMYDLFTYARRRGIECLCTPWDLPSVDALIRFGMPAFKVASADLTNHELLDALADTGKPLLVSTGMSEEADIRDSVRRLEDRQAAFGLLHCVAAYPPPLCDLRLGYLRRLHALAGGRPVGYSGHEPGWVVAVAAVALGARIIEKHITLDRNSLGNDHKISLLPDEFQQMVAAIREVEQTLDGDEPRRFCHGERISLQSLGKSVVAARRIAAGEIVTRDMLTVRSPGTGLRPSQRSLLLGRRVSRTIEQHEPFYSTDLQGAAPVAVRRRFRRRWGIPVRYHDFERLTEAIQPELVEFHMSYKDLALNPHAFVHGRHDCQLTVHCPEQFDDDVVLDLASGDDSVRRRSMGVLQHAIDRARALQEHFPSTVRPLVIANLGGFSNVRRPPASVSRALYERIADGLARLDTRGVEVLPQTLPPFPWFFGGQHFASVFVDAAETSWFCEQFGYRLCLDVAHTYMAATHAGERSDAWFEIVASLVAHVHVADARGVDGEGLQIGDGEIDFASLMRTLDRLAPSASFIPEIWDGHWNAGHGFRVALDRLGTWVSDVSPCQPGAAPIATRD